MSAEERKQNATETEQRAVEGVEHLQRAARELVRAARAFLDVIEDVIEDPDRVRGAAEQVADLVEPVVKATARVADPSRFQRIDVD